MRNERQISAREMSLALGQNESYINKIETGKSSTTISSFLNICEYLAVSPADFFNDYVRNSVNVQEIIQYFQRLTPHQAEYMLDFLKDLSGGNH
ncbi:MAG: helix-turn-helix transcriptional regulator [Treponema sp.]|nr:helix-turn-helix transcriptional regulator [Treponema sp.]